MKNLNLLIFLFLMFSCSDYVESEKISSTGKFSVIAKVNRTNKNAEFYAEPIFEIYNSDKEIIAKIASGAGDFNEWQVGWSDSGNYLLLNSSDIGIKVWEIDNNGFKEIEPTAELYSEALYLLQD